MTSASGVSRFFFGFAAFVICIAGLKAAESLVVPFFLAVFIATVAATPVFWLENHKVPNGLAIFLVVVGLLIALSGLGAMVAQSVGLFTEQLPFYQDRLAMLTTKFTDMLQPLGMDFSEDMLSRFDPGMALSMVGTTLRGLGGVLSNSLLILLTVIFILAESSSFPKKLKNILSDPDQDMPLFNRFGENLNQYMAIKTTVSVITGVIISIFLAILGVDFPILWGMLAFLLNYVPTIGSIIASVPPVLLALIQLGPFYAAVTGAGFVVVNLVMGNVVEPKFMGKGLGLSTLVVFLSLIFWGWILGPVGLLLSVPLTMTAKIALEARDSTAWIGYLLGPANAEINRQTQSIPPTSREI
ncbi:MAG: AI-2E family transporter [Pseudomonadales bacterium]|nr:AI-2E family transporter [Pseudomonadales bacterium]